MRVGITTSIATAIAIGVLVATGGGPALGTANLWVDTNGGTCIRSASLVAYVDAAACSSLNAAYQAALLGDLVLVKGGTYPEQTITDEASKDTTGLADDVVIAEADGETVVLVNLIIGGEIEGSQGPDHLTLRGFSDDSFDSGDCDWESYGGDIWDITFDDVTVCSMQINHEQSAGQGNDVSDYLTIKNSEYMGCTTSAGYTCANIKIDGADQFVFQDNYVHDFHIGNVNDHFECMFISDTNVMTVERNTFEDCAIYDIFIQHCDPVNGGRCEIEDLTIQNNFFDRPWAGEPSSPSQDIRATAVNIGTSEPIVNLLVRYNSFADGSAFSQENTPDITNGRVIGNIMEGACVGDVTYDYNLFLGGATCGTNASSVSSADVYTNAAYLGAGGNYHLKSGANTAVDYVSPTSADYALADDIDGDSRPAGAARDAGGDER